MNYFPIPSNVMYSFCTQTFNFMFLIFYTINNLIFYDKL